MDDTLTLTKPAFVVSEGEDQAWRNTRPRCFREAPGGETIVRVDHRTDLTTQIRGAGFTEIHGYITGLTNFPANGHHDQSFRCRIIELIEDTPHSRLVGDLRGADSAGSELRALIKYISTKRDILGKRPIHSFGERIDVAGLDGIPCARIIEPSVRKMDILYVHLDNWTWPTGTLFIVHSVFPGGI